MNLTDVSTIALSTTHILVNQGSLVIACCRQENSLAVVLGTLCIWVACAGQVLKSKSLYIWMSKAANKLYCEYTIFEFLISQLVVL